MSRPPRIGLALGSGSARGWSHIGVIRALEAAGISPQVVCGTSIGALVGAAYAAGEIERLHEWVRSLRWQAVVSLIDLKMDGGLGGVGTVYGPAVGAFVMVTVQEMFRSGFFGLFKRLGAVSGTASLVKVAEVRPRRTSSGSGSWWSW